MENKFIKGLFVNNPSDKAPDFVVAKMSISADTFIPFLKDNVDGKGYMRFDILKSKEGKLYAKLDDFKKTEVVNGTLDDIDKMFDESKQDEIDVKDIPF